MSRQQPDLEPMVPVGFDYAEAIKELRTVMSLTAIAEYLGYGSAAGVYHVATQGVIPSHPQGEALWALYFSKFNRRPPMSPDQLAGRFNSGLQQSLKGSRR